MPGHSIRESQQVGLEVTGKHHESTPLLQGRQGFLNNSFSDTIFFFFIVIIIIQGFFRYYSSNIFTLNIFISVTSSPDWTNHLPPPATYSGSLRAVVTRRRILSD